MDWKTIRQIISTAFGTSHNNTIAEKLVNLVEVANNATANFRRMQISSGEADIFNWLQAVEKDIAVCQEELQNLIDSSAIISLPKRDLTHLIDYINRVVSSIRSVSRIARIYELKMTDAPPSVWELAFLNSEATLVLIQMIETLVSKRDINRIGNQMRTLVDLEQRADNCREQGEMFNIKRLNANEIGKVEYDGWREVIRKLESVTDTVKRAAVIVRSMARQG